MVINHLNPVAPRVRWFITMACHCAYHSLVNFVGSILTIVDLNSVYEKLIQASGCWLDLGLSLGLGHGTLKNIKDDYHGNKDCLREMLAARLKTGPLTYSELCLSLKAPTVAQDALAEAIEEACTGMNSDEANFNPVSISMSSQVLVGM